MKRNIMVILMAIIIFPACHVFLGSDPGTEPKEIFEAIWSDFNKTYALLDHKKIDWHEVYKTYSPQITATMTDQQLFDKCADMLKVLNDAHVSLMSSFAYSNSGGRFDTSNMEPFNLNAVKKYLNNGGAVAGDEMFLYGTFSSRPNIGYIHIAGFAGGEVGMALSQDWVKSINGIIKSLENTEALVLDVRGNRGGLISNVDYISSRFAAAEKEYVTIRTKDGPGKNDFSKPLSNEIKPVSTAYTNPIVLLTNKQTISAGEWFTLALRSQSHVTIAGTATNGAFSLSLQRPLSNGWQYTVSVQKVTDINGICYEGTGIPPDFVKQNTVENIQLNIDDQLQYALGLL